jgi:diguanylate cyclase (GGDEF)-like protein/PAS domain S-box-containing protein
MLTQFNNRAFENLGYTSKEFKKLKLSDIEVIEFPDGISRHMEKIKKEGRGTFETKHRNKGGQIRDILVNAKVINIREKDYIQSTWIDITERKMMEEQLKAAAITDDLTGLFNRQGFFALATQQCKLADRTKRLMSLLYLDINGLKTINDELGHREGDRALIDTAGILKMTFRESDIIARTGGDEFAVLLTEPSEPDIENVVINHLRSKLAEFNIRKYRNYELILSMGMAHYDPERSCSIDELIVKADDLMYEDKKHHMLLQNTETVLKTNIKRRKYKRYMTGGNCMAELDSLQKVRIRDISNGGLCLISPQSPYMSSICKIRIFTTDNEEFTKTGVVGGLSLTGEVIHRENNLSLYKYGLKFIDMKKNVKSSLDKFINNLAD